MTQAEKAQAEQLKKHGDVKEALEQAAPPPETPSEEPRGRITARLVVYGLVIALLLAFRVAVGRGLLSFSTATADLLRRASLGLVFVVLVLLAEKAVEIFFLPRLDTVSRYNLKRVVRLVLGLAIIVILVSAVFVDWYAAAVSLGLASLILGFALQTPITSFIGWIYILVRRPYRVGDRIVIGAAAGDVIDVSYFDTTLWEFGGSYLSTDHPSGRIIKFPNSNVLTTPVYNYSWPLFPYIWNEIKFPIAYDSDLEFVTKTMCEVAEEEIGETMMERVRVYRELLAETPVDELQVQERPVVLFRASENTWLEAILRYLVDPKKAGRTKTDLIKKLLARLNAAPGRVGLPRSDTR